MGVPWQWVIAAYGGQQEALSGWLSGWFKRESTYMNHIECTKVIA